MSDISKKALPPVLAVGVLLSTAAPAAAQVGRIELDIAGYLCGF